MKTFKCDACGDIDHVVVDGYGVGDRLLEGVEFEIRWNAEGTGYTAKVKPEYARYFSDLNEARWLARIAESTEHDDTAACGKCGRDVDLPELHERPAAKPITARLMSAGDLIQSLMGAPAKTQDEMDADRKFLAKATPQELVREVEKKPKRRKRGRK